MPIMKTLNGYEVVDAKARQDIENIEVPTKVSQLENDKGYLTEHQDLSTYATKTYVNNAVAAVEPDLTSYATKTYVTNTVQAAIDDIPEPDLDNYYTKAQTDSAIGEAIDGIEIPETDISGKADLVHKHTMADITDYTAPDLTNYYTKSETYNKTEVDGLIANIPGGGGGSGDGGSGVKIIRLPSSTSNWSDELKAELWQYLNQYYNDRSLGNATIPDNVVFYIQSLSMPACWVTALTVNGTISQYGTYLMITGFESKEEKYCHQYTIYFNSDGSFQRLQTQHAPVAEAASGDDWSIASDQYDSNLYNATEIYVMARDQDAEERPWLFSHAILPSGVLGHRTYERFTFTTANYSNSAPYWSYTGYFFSLNNFNYSDSDVFIAYKT